MTEPNEHALAAKPQATTPVDDAEEEKASTETRAAEKLRALTTEYEAKLEEVAELITRVRHEINNPLTGVLGQAQLLLREELPERAKKRAETIEALAIRIRDIVAQLRQVQKSSKG